MISVQVPGGSGVVEVSAANDQDCNDATVEAEV